MAAGVVMVVMVSRRMPVVGRVIGSIVISVIPVVAAMGGIVGMHMVECHHTAAQPGDHAECQQPCEPSSHAFQRTPNRFAGKRILCARIRNHVSSAPDAGTKGRCFLP